MFIPEAVHPVEGVICQLYPVIVEPLFEINAVGVIEPGAQIGFNGLILIEGSPVIITFTLVVVAGKQAF